MRLVSAFALMVLAAVPFAALCQAQDYPSKQIRIVVPFAPGGGIDITTRLVAQKLGDAWGRPVIVENKTGASGFIGAEFVAKQPADGHTLLVTLTSTHAIAQHLYTKLPFDPFKDFAPVTQIAFSPLILVVNAEVPARNLKDFIDYAKSKGSLNYGTFGIGSSAHLYGEMLNLIASANLVQVPYKGEVLSLQDLVGGQIPAAFLSITATKPQTVTGKLRPLAITGTRRWQAMPQVPTFLESGYAGLEVVGWSAVFAPAGTPVPIVDKLSAQIASIVRSPEVAARLIELGTEPVGNTPREFAANWRTDSDRFAEIIRRANIKID